MRAGTLDQPSGVRPDVHIFTKSKVGWIRIPESVPALEIYYDTKALWPAASFSRASTLAPCAGLDSATVINEASLKFELNRQGRVFVAVEEVGGASSAWDSVREDLP